MNWRTAGSAASHRLSSTRQERKHRLRQSHLRALPSETPATDARVATLPQPQSDPSPNDRWVLNGVFSHIHDRDELFEDLEYAVKQRTSPTVLVLFGFKKLAEQLETLLEPDANILLGRIAKRLAHSTELAAVLYEPRRGDFCGLFGGRFEDIAALLVDVTAEIDDELRTLGIQTALGVVSLPAEAKHPLTALKLADKRRKEVAGDLRPSRRVTAYTRIMATLHTPGDHDSEDDPELVRRALLGLVDGDGSAGDPELVRARNRPPNFDQSRERAGPS